MELSKDNVREISIVSNIAKSSHNNNEYKDLLRVSSNWISYKRTYRNNEVPSVEWSYKTTSYIYDRKWSNLIYVCLNELNKKKECMNHSTDSSGYTFRVSFKDGKHIDIKGTSNLSRDGFADTAYMLQEMIPHLEPSSECIERHCYHYSDIALSRKNIEQLDLSTVDSIMYAEGGAMGIPGLVEITTVDGKRFSNMPGLDGCDIDQCEVLSLFDGLNPFRKSFSIDLESFEMNGSEWVYVGLGAGNHLYLRHKLYLKVINDIFDARVSVRYSNWMDLTHPHDC